MNAIFAAALEIETICRAEGFRFCFIGGLAVQRWGQPRMTADVDLTLLTGFGGEAPYVDALLSKLRGRIPDARQFALRYRTLLLVTSNDTHADVALGAMPFEERAVARASASGGRSSERQATSANESAQTDQLLELIRCCCPQANERDSPPSPLGAAGQYHARGSLDSSRAGTPVVRWPRRGT